MSDSMTGRRIMKFCTDLIRLMNLDIWLIGVDWEHSELLILFHMFDFISIIKNQLQNNCASSAGK